MDRRLFLQFKNAFSKLKKMWSLLSEYEDITDQVTLLNGWADSLGSFRVLKAPGGLIISGALKAGTTAVNTNIAALPNLETVNQYVYGIAQNLGKHTTSLFSVRAGYLRIDNNLPFDGAAGNIFAMNAFIPYGDFNLLGGVLHSS